MSFLDIQLCFHDNNNNVDDDDDDDDTYCDVAEVYDVKE